MVEAVLGALSARHRLRLRSIGVAVGIVCK